MTILELVLLAIIVIGGACLLVNYIAGKLFHHVWNE